MLIHISTLARIRKLQFANTVFIVIILALTNSKACNSGCKRGTTFSLLHPGKIRESSVVIATRLWAGRLEFWGLILGGSWKIFSSSPRPERLWSPPSHLPNGYLSLGVKWPGREADHSAPSSAEVKEWSYTSTPPIRLHGVVVS
jgi:hypothetical protein